MDEGLLECGPVTQKTFALKDAWMHNTISASHSSQLAHACTPELREAACDSVSLKEGWKYRVPYVLGQKMYVVHKISSSTLTTFPIPLF